MKQLLKASLFFIACFISLNSFSSEVITLQTGWKFSKGNPQNAAQVKFDDSKWQDVRIPHDWAIYGPVEPKGEGNTGKLPWRGEAWYRNALDIKPEWNGKTIYLVFDGVMSNPEIFINGKLAGKWDYGYNSFYFDITPFLNFKGKNELAVHVDNRYHDSRWYPGAGIYRKVQMIVADPVHVAVWGTQVTTPVVKPQFAEVRVAATVKNQSSTDARIKIENTIINAEGKEITKKQALSEIIRGREQMVETTLELSDPQHWDINNPVLYQVKTVVSSGDKILDTYLTPFGVRTMRFTADNGFYLNDKRVQFNGVCLHHDQGPLGGAFYPRAMERQLEIMKSMGCNAIRTSHNVPAPELLELCDKMGLLVFDEAFDKYDGKADINKDTDFEEFAQRNIKNFVERDRNHPCIFIWSVGNEMADVQTNKNNGLYKLQTMVNYVRKFDPTRPVTMACDMAGEAVYRHFDYYDVHSWNYQHRYDLARKMEPNKPVIISESASTVSTRGYYDLTLPSKKDTFTRDMQVSSYDLNAPWWAEIPDDDFMWQQDEPYVAGEFVWTGFDYLGEPTPYVSFMMGGLGMADAFESRSSYFGIVDLCGIPKDRYYLYKSYWDQKSNTVHILPHWNWQGKATNVPVFVYTNGDCAELFLNGKSLGMQYKNYNSRKSTERFRLMWNNVAYEPGELKAVAYKEGKIIGEEVLKTAGEPYQVRLTPDRNTIHANGMDLSYILAEAVDKDGNVCPLAGQNLNITITGPAHIAGVGNGNPQSVEEFQSNQVKLLNGKAMIIIGSDFEKGNVIVTVTGEGLEKQTVAIVVE
ncbi:MAG TPA: glycoside hydrolase family 2 TIM barrel-domain containing protein [Bacteroidales bacterium]|nr:glycoside hydrolase family 2 TIM barrel-domain containing protein [Bacteroidales bacterium]